MVFQFFCCTIPQNVYFHHQTSHVVENSKIRVTAPATPLAAYPTAPALGIASIFLLVMLYIYIMLTPD